MGEPQRKRKQYTAEDIARFRAQYAVAPDQAAALVSVDRATLYRRLMPAVYDGRIQSIMIGTCRRIVVESLLTFWAKNGGAA